MDNFGINRLNFSNIVEKHLRELPETKYFNPTQVSSDPNKSSKATKSFEGMMHDKYNIQGKIDSIVAHVHTQLKDRNPTPKSKPLPRYGGSKEVTAVAKEQGQSLAIKYNNKIRTKANHIIIDNPSGKNKHVIIDNPANTNISIPRIKALCSHREKKRLHHTIPSVNDNTDHYVNQQRFEEAKRKQEFFEGMIQDQKQLQHDRQSIAQEIFTMRSYLDDIKGRLDSSLKKLEDNKTYTQCHPKKGQKEEKTKNRHQNHIKTAKKLKS